MSASIYAEMGNDSAWVDRFGIQLSTTREILDRRLLQTTTAVSYLQHQQQQIQKFQTCECDHAKINDSFAHLKEGESLLRTLSTETEEWEKEGKGQILYTQEWAKPLNDIPYFLPATAFFKTILVPFFAILLPLAMFFLPYFISRYVFGVPMSFTEYKQALGLIWNSGDWSITSGGGGAQLRKLFQYGWVIFGIVQNIYQPIQQALHIHSIHKTMLQKGQTLRDFFINVSSLCTELQLRDVTSDVPIDEPLRLYAFVRENPLLVGLILRSIATTELNWRLAMCTRLCFVDYTVSNGPFCTITDFCDPSIDDAHKVLSDFKIVPGANHCILTGPNKGGKSSLLRAVLLNIWLAQTLGVAFAGSMKLQPFDWIESGLRIADMPGQKSLFERELLFATGILEKARSGRNGFVIFDELFHSTNPPDGERTAQLFLSKLWNFPQVFSLVSTHVFSLVENSPPRVQRLCVPAILTENAIEYSFRLTSGICKVSSVCEIYKEYDFPVGSADKKRNERCVIHTE